MAFGTQVYSRDDPDDTGSFWQPTPQEPRQQPTLTDAESDAAESRVSAIADILGAISGPFGVVSVPHCGQCARRPSRVWEIDTY